MENKSVRLTSSRRYNEDKTINIEIVSKKQNCDFKYEQHCEKIEEDKIHDERSVRGKDIFVKKSNK